MGEPEGDVEHLVGEYVGTLGGGRSASATEAHGRSLRSLTGWPSGFRPHPSTRTARETTSREKRHPKRAFG